MHSTSVNDLDTEQKFLSWLSSQRRYEAVSALDALKLLVRSTVQQPTTDSRSRSSAANSVHQSLSQRWGAAALPLLTEFSRTEQAGGGGGGGGQNKQQQQQQILDGCVTVFAALNPICVAEWRQQQEAVEDDRASSVSSAGSGGGHWSNHSSSNSLRPSSYCHYQQPQQQQPQQQAPPGYFTHNHHQQQHQPHHQFYSHHQKHHHHHHHHQSQQMMMGRMNSNNSGAGQQRSPNSSSPQQRQLGGFSVSTCGAAAAAAATSAGGNSPKQQQPLTLHNLRQAQHQLHNQHHHQQQHNYYQPNQSQQQQQQPLSSGGPPKHLCQTVSADERLPAMSFFPVFAASALSAPRAAKPANSGLPGNSVPWRCYFCTSEARGHQCQQCGRARDTAALRVFIGQLSKQGAGQCAQELVGRLVGGQLTAPILHVEEHTHKSTGQSKGCCWLYLQSLSDVWNVVRSLHKRAYVTCADGAVGFRYFDDPTVAFSPPEAVPPSFTTLRSPSPSPPSSVNCEQGTEDDGNNINSSSSSSPCSAAVSINPIRVPTVTEEELLMGDHGTLPPAIQDQLHHSAITAEVPTALKFDASYRQQLTIYMQQLNQRAGATTGINNNNSNTMNTNSSSGGSSGGGHHRSVSTQATANSSLPPSLPPSPQSSSPSAAPGGLFPAPPSSQQQQQPQQKRQEQGFSWQEYLRATELANAESHALTQQGQIEQRALQFLQQQREQQQQQQQQQRAGSGTGLDAEAPPHDEHPHHQQEAEEAGCAAVNHDDHAQEEPEAVRVNFESPSSKREQELLNQGRPQRRHMWATEEAPALPNCCELHVSEHPRAFLGQMPPQPTVGLKCPGSQCQQKQQQDRSTTGADDEDDSS